MFSLDQADPCGPVLTSFLVWDDSRVWYWLSATPDYFGHALRYQSRNLGAERRNTPLKACHFAAALQKWPFGHLTTLPFCVQCIITISSRTRWASMSYTLLHHASDLRCSAKKCAFFCFLLCAIGVSNRGFGQADWWHFLPLLELSSQVREVLV